MSAATAGAPAGAPHLRTGRAGSAVRRAGVTGLLAAALLVFVVLPLAFTNQLFLTIGFFTLLYLGAAVAWNLFSGYSGYICLGHAVFFGTGAYIAGIAARDLRITGTGEFALLPLALAAGAVVAVPFGLVALRVRRHTFVVITIAIFFIFQLLAFDLKTTGGTAGLFAPFLSWTGAVFYRNFYYMALALAVVVVALSWLVKGSRFGLQLRAIRDDEDRAASLGVRAMPVKLTAFVISGAITGLAGGLWFFFIGQVLPDSGFDPIFDLTVALMAFLGGLGTVSGPVLGALIIEPLQQVLNLQVSNGYLGEILLGALLLIVVLFIPRGLVPTCGEWAKSWSARRARRRTSAVGGPAAGEPRSPGAIAGGTVP